MKKVICIVGMIALIATMMVITPAAAFELGECDWDVYSGGSIQGAINSASVGDTICVHAGTYSGYVNLNKPYLTVKGEGADVVTYSDPSFQVYIGAGAVDAHGCILEGFKIANSDAGALDVEATAPDCIIRNCVFEGITGGNAPLWFVPSNTTFENNVVSDVSDPDSYILDVDGSFSTIANNFFMNTSAKYTAIDVGGDSCTIVNNTIINHNPIMTSGAAIKSKGANYIIANNTIVNCTQIGIYLAGGSSTNTVTKNNISSNGRCAFRLYNAGESSKIYLNDIIGNTENVTYGGTLPAIIFWNSTEQIEYVYGGTTYTNYLGNYWSDYTGTDGNSDGIGDAAYPILSTYNDYRPLMAGYENYLGEAAEPPHLVTYTISNRTITPPQTSEIDVKFSEEVEAWISIEDPDRNPVKELYHEAAVTNPASKTWNGTYENDTVVPAGDYYVNVTGTNTTTGLSVVNNTEVITVVITEPDLTPTAITTPANIFATESNGINATIANTGSGDAGAFNVSLSADGTVVDSTSVAGLSAGASTEVSLEWTPAASGTYELCVVADCDGAVDESDETNNVTCMDVDMEDMPAAKPDLIVTAINAYRLEEKYGYVWFNLTNYVDVTVKNNGTADADAFNVSLYADGEPIGVLPVINLSNGSSETLVFKWRPEGEDPLRWTDTAEGAILSQTGTSKTYTLEAVVDEGNEVSESDESNNNMTVSETVGWNGYSADEPLENYAHGKVRGGMIYTTGDGWYHSGEGGAPGTVYGTYSELPYDLEIPGDTKLARLYFYYTWAKPEYKAPKVGITLKTPSDDIYALNMEKSYNDIKCFGGWNLAWGTYTYDITGYVTESGTYIVNVTNLNDGTDTDFAHHCSFAAPAILVVYENETTPEREYWVNEGADVLWGKKDMTGLLLEDCINNATFEGSIDLSRVENATLAVVSPWGGFAHNVLYFNGIALGTGVYDNGVYPIGDISLDGIRMYSTCPSNWRQEVGVNLSDVTSYLNASVNIAGQGDDGDCMMPANAFLVVEYEEEEPPELPDLNVTAVTPPANVFANESNSINATIANIGGEAAGAFNVSLSADGTEIDEVNVTAGLDAGNSTEVTFEWTPSASGTYELCVVADCDGVIDESDETNNVTCEDVEVEGARGEPGAGCAAVTKFHDTIHGGVYFEQQGYAQYNLMTKTFNDVPDGLKVARIYTGFWQGSPGKGGNFNITIFNATGSYTTPTYQACDPCPGAPCAGYQSDRCGALNWSGNVPPNVPSGDIHDYIVGCGVQFVSFNATPYITPGSNTITVRTSCDSCTCWDGRIYVIALLVVYENASMPEITYWINEGALYLEKGSNCDGPDDHLYASKYFDGTHVSNPAGVRLWSLGWPHVINADTKLNDNNIGGPDIIESYGSYEVLLRWENIPTSYLDDTSNFLEYYDLNPVYERAFAEVLIVQGPSDKPDLTVTGINAYHNNTGCPAWFNLSNEIDVTVKNNGSANAGASNVSLYIEDVFFGKLPVPSLSAGASETVTFENWKPVGDDCLQPPCEFEWSYHDYNLTAVADSDNDIAESNETNNETTVVDRACYNGYMADEPLENVAHGTLHGGLLFTTGDGVYSSLYSVGDTQVTNYDITLPAGASLELSHLNVYYTWNKPEGTCPEMEVNITTPGGTTYTLPLMKAYNDIKCTCPGATWVLPFGNYVYNVADYITESGTYTVTVKNVCTACQYFCPAAPGLTIVYEDANAPRIEYWINEGADVLMGGRRYPTSSNLAWWENINNATFTASTETEEVVNATLGVVAPWGDDVPNDILFFNEIELGRGVYNGCSSPYSKTIDSLSMEIGASNAQVGINVTSVTALYLNDSDNVVGQADDGDNIMAANAFLVVEYKEEEPPEQPDLIVESITANCGYLFANESNDISATIKNNGTGDAGAFNVSFNVDDFSKEVRITGLAAGANTTVSVTDPTLRNAGDPASITVTADCNVEVSESNETNNVSIRDETVMNNGYKGKRYTGGEDITTWKTFELNGNLLYSPGDSYYLSAYSYPHWTTYNASWTASDLPVPDGASVEEARLFVPYTWDKADVMPDEVNLIFNGLAKTLVAHYSDEKMYGSSKPYGMLTYNVTDDFDTGGNVANLTNSHPGGNNVSMRGMLLVVIYADDSEALRKIFVNEEFDLLYSGSSQCTTPEEATAYAPFAGPAIDLAKVENATLITIAPGAGPNEGELIFNGHTWTDVWNFGGSSQIGIDERNVTVHLNETDNEAGFQSSGDWMEASNAFLVVEYVEEKPDLVITNKSEEWVVEGSTYNVTYTVKNIGDASAGASTTSIKIDGAEVATDPVPELAAGANYTNELGPFAMSGDSDTIKVCADKEDVVAESNEENNCKENVLECLSAPQLVTYTISNTTITPPQTTEIDVEFSERVEAWISIEDSDRNLVNELYHSPGVTDPDPKTWDGTYTDGTQVPDGDYYVNVTGLNTTTGLSVVNDTETITVTSAEAPDIISFAPPSPVSDTEGVTRTFNITTNQIVNVNWLINGTEVFNQSAVNFSEYTNESAVTGYWNVTAYVYNENGTDIQTWWWTVGIERPVIVFISPTPENGTEVTVNHVLINVTAASTHAIGTVILNWNGVNETMEPMYAGGESYFYSNKTDLSNGDYIYRVYANDTNDNWGVSETRFLSVNVTGAPEAVPTADSLGVEDASGRSGTYVEVPVSITNVMNGPVQGIRLRVDYNESVLNLTNIGKGDLTSAWTDLRLGEDRHTMVIATTHSGDAIPDGSSGSVVLLNFHVVSSPGDTSPMNMTLIELSNPEGIVGRTAPARNGTFVVSKLGAIVGRITYACNGTGIVGVNVNLTNESTVNTTMTNETGYYNFTEVIPDSYVVNASKSGFFDNATEVTVIAGETTTADMTLWLKGDLNNDGSIADAGDVVLMLKASVGDIPGDMLYDLNGNGEIADAGDIVLMLRASVGDIELL